MYKLSEKQRTWVTSLITDYVPAEQQAAWLHGMDNLADRQKFENGLAVLKQMQADAKPVRETKTQIVGDLAKQIDALGRLLPVGSNDRTHYALPTSEGGWKFYSVDRPTDGQWEGRTFVKVEASDDTHRLGMPTQLLVLEAILKDVNGALSAYGKELEHCGLCGRTLTDDESRARGIGPICLGKL